MMYNIYIKTKEVLVMKRRKFSLKYRIEKWFFEDSLDCLSLLIDAVIGLLLLAIMFGAIFFLPALFH